MDPDTLDQLQRYTLLVEASEALDRIAADLAAAIDLMRAGSVGGGALDSLTSAVGELAWWSGRMTAATSQDIPDDLG